MADPAHESSPHGAPAHDEHAHAHGQFDQVGLFVQRFIGVAKHLHQMDFSRTLGHIEVVSDLDHLADPGAVEVRFIQLLGEKQPAQPCLPVPAFQLGLASEVL